MSITPTEDRRAVHLTEQQVSTIKNALQIVQEGYAKQGGDDPRVDPLLDDAYRAMSVELIQRIPTRGDRWRGLTNQELRDVIVALESDVTMYRDPADKTRIEALWRDADEELTRRGGQPDDEEDEAGPRMPWNHRQEIQRQQQPGAPEWQGP